MRRTLRKYLPSREKLKRTPALRPLANWLDRHGSWRLDSRSVSLAVAVGLFFGLLIPVAQILCAVLAAMVLRANLAVAAAATLVTNPLTFPPIYYAAYRLGKLLTGGADAGPAAPPAVPEAAAAGRGVAHWLQALLDWATGVGQPLVLGLLVLATVSALAGYLLVKLLWHWHSLGRLRRRRLLRRTQ